MKNLLIIVFLILAIQLQAQERIGEKEAFVTAERFLTQQDASKNKLSLSQTIDGKLSGQPNLFVFSLEPQGFIIVSALDEVLAYSLESNLSTSDETPDPAAYWINLYNEQTDFLLQHPELARNEPKSQQDVEPLLTCQWAQGCYYNEGCPSDTSGPCQHVTAGCVAVAMAQIMYYHKCPLLGNDSLTYSCAPYGTLSANFGQTSYQWDDMVDHLNEGNSAVATLISHCGISVMMRYSPNGSIAQKEDALNAFRRFFLYPVATLTDRSKCNDEEWILLIKKNLDLGLPLYYAGTSSKGGHAFVCDGYDRSGLFHFNFGWNGVSDGYYSISDPGGFSSLQSVIHDLYPSAHIDISSDSHGIIYVTPEGTGDGSSWEQSTNKLQLAVYKSQTEDCSVWVKEGTYSRPSDDYMFYIGQQCRLYGGFSGDEPYDYDLSQRNFEMHPSILDGNKKWGVINASTESQTDPILIDGFTIQNGYATYGGGVFTNNDIYIKNCIFCYNHAQSNGGAFSNQNINLSISAYMENCEFYSNDAKNKGGAIHDCGFSNFLHCRFHDNIAKGNGGAIYCSPNMEHRFINCFISNNSAQNGGGIYNNHGNTQLWNCLINNNTANNGGGCYCQGGLCLFNCTIVKNRAITSYGGVGVYSFNEIKNCIIWGNAGGSQIGPNRTYAYCAVQNDMSGSGLNFNASAANDGESPGFYIRFIDPDVTYGIAGQGGDWHLQPNSCCVDLGVVIPDQPETDLEGNPRIWNEAIDLGAYEMSIDHCEELNGSRAIPIPNPASDHVEIFMPLIDELELLNLNGERITHVKGHRQTVELDVSPFPNGVYIVHIRCLDKHYYSKLIVNH